MTFFRLGRLYFSLAAIAVLLSTGCKPAATNPAPETTASSDPQSAARSTLPGSAQQARSQSVPNPAHLFKEVTGELGFPQDPARYPDGTFMTPEITPAGVAIFDFNNDGRLDILQVQHPLPTSPWEKQIASSAPNRLFKQLDNGTFQEIAGGGGVAGKGFHHGVAIGDVNGDGFADVYICNFGGPDEFFLNNGNGSFADATGAAGFLSSSSAILISKDNWSSTAAFFDYDGDGDLDLWVTHFATFDPMRKCKSTANTEELDYCGPHTFPGQLATLWQNDGTGKFVDITAKAGISAAGRGWGVIAADLTGDGLADVLQANDEEPNQFWVNQGDGTFVDEALLRGCGVNALGSVEANMGVAVGDIRNTGQGAFDIYITHFGGETNTLWAAQKDGLYGDVTATSGMGLVDRPYTGWGCGFFDFDNDGILDLAVGNGRVARGPVRPEAKVGPFWNLFAEPNLLFRGNARGAFADIGKVAGDFTKDLEVHRSLAFADLHNRGAVDLITVNLDNTLRIFRNDAVPSTHHWIEILPMLGKREAIGARITVQAGDLKRSALCLRAYSYLASNDPRVHFGLGTRTRVEAVEVVWPSGKPQHEQFEAAAVDNVLVCRQGEGKAL